MNPTLSLILLCLFICGGAYVAHRLVTRLYYAWPHRFEWQGETFIWIPDDPKGLPFFRTYYAYGTFQYADGRPVTDQGLARALNETWMAKCARSHEAHNTVGD